MERTTSSPLSTAALSLSRARTARQAPTQAVLCCRPGQGKEHVRTYGTVASEHRRFSSAGVERPPKSKNFQARSAQPRCQGVERRFPHHSFLWASGGGAGGRGREWRGRVQWWHWWWCAAAAGLVGAPDGRPPVWRAAGARRRIQRTRGAWDRAVSAAARRNERAMGEPGGPVFYSSLTGRVQASVPLLISVCIADPAWLPLLRYWFCHVLIT